jgi:hypothetical protein
MNWAKDKYVRQDYSELHIREEAILSLLVYCSEQIEWT